MLYLTDFDDFCTIRKRLRGRFRMVQKSSKSVRYRLSYDEKTISVINVFMCTMGAVPFYNHINMWVRKIGFTKRIFMFLVSFESCLSCDFNKMKHFTVETL